MRQDHVQLIYKLSRKICVGIIGGEMVFPIIWNSNPLSPSWMEDYWANEWAASSNTLREFIECPSNKPPGHDLSRNAGVRLNRLRSGWAKTASFLAKTGTTDSEWWPYGSLQTVHHIINARPLFGAHSGSQSIKTMDPATRAWLETKLPLWRPLLAVVKRKMTEVGCSNPNF